MPPVIPVPPERRAQTRIVPGRVDKNGRPYYVRGIPRDAAAAARKLAGQRRGMAAATAARNAWKETGVRYCGGCDRELPIEDFGVRGRGKKAGEPYSQCMVCRKVAWETVKARIAENRPPPCKRGRNKKLQKKYGITLKQYQEMLAKQGGACAICGSTTTFSRGYRTVEKGKSNFMVDHCHTTGKVRGLLCGKCNTALGLLRDNPDNCRRAAEYLERSQQES